MKQLLTTLLLATISLSSTAQRTQPVDQPRDGRTYVGSGFNLGFFNGFIGGLNPEIGYSLNRFIDAGLATNFTLITQNDVNMGSTDRFTTIGAGPYVRIWPVNMLYVGGQFEYNLISFSTKANGEVFNRTRFSAPSMLVGAGYGNRFIGESQFYTSIMIDVLKDPRSPYTDQFNRSLPVFRTAFLFYLRPKSQRNR